MLGAVSLFAEAGGGLYWVAAGILLATSGAVPNAWVLLVEILVLAHVLLQAGSH